MKNRNFYWLFITVIILSIAILAGPFDNLPTFKPNANMPRTEIPDIFKWNLKDLCESDAKWDQEIKQYHDDLKSIKNFHSKLNTAKGLAA